MLKIEWTKVTQQNRNRRFPVCDVLHYGMDENTYVENSYFALMSQ